MKKNTLFILIMAIAAAFIVCTSFSSCNTSEPKFYDGEGNEVAIKDVQLLVKASYTIVSDSEYNRLDSVFYSTKHRP